MRNGLVARNGSKPLIFSQSASYAYVLRWGYGHRRAMRGAPAAAARVAEADFDGLLHVTFCVTTPVEGLILLIIS